MLRDRQRGGEVPDAAPFPCRGVAEFGFTELKSRAPFLGTESGFDDARAQEVDGREAWLELDGRVLSLRACKCFLRKKSRGRDGRTEATVVFIGMNKPRERMGFGRIWRFSFHRRPICVSRFLLRNNVGRIVYSARHRTRPY